MTRNDHREKKLISLAGLELYGERKIATRSTMTCTMTCTHNVNGKWLL